MYGDFHFKTYADVVFKHKHKMFIYKIHLKIKSNFVILNCFVFVCHADENYRKQISSKTSSVFIILYKHFVYRLFFIAISLSHFSVALYSSRLSKQSE